MVRLAVDVQGSVVWFSVRAVLTGSEVKCKVQIVSRLDIALDCDSEAKLFELFGNGLPHTVRLWSGEPAQERKTVVPVQTNILFLQLLTKLGKNERSN